MSIPTFIHTPSGLSTDLIWVLVQSCTIRLALLGPVSVGNAWGKERCPLPGGVWPDFAGPRPCPHRQVPKSQTVSLSFRVFDLEQHPSCRYDSLEIFAGSGTSGQQLGRFCGTFRPAPVVASGNQVTLRMRSDEGTGGRGFLLWYSGRATSGTGETSLTSAAPPLLAPPPAQAPPQP